METRQIANFRATAGDAQDFGATPQEALNSLMTQLSGDALTPIVIWPYKRSLISTVTKIIGLMSHCVSGS